jgi:hypothetical protein
VTSRGVVPAVRKTSEWLLIYFHSQQEMTGYVLCVAFKIPKVANDVNGYKQAGNFMHCSLHLFLLLLSLR